MTYALFEDEMPEHPKLVHVGPLGLALHVRSICYSNRHRLNGTISDAVAGFLVADMPKGRAVIARMLQTAPGEKGPLWTRIEGGYLIEKIGLFQPSREHVEAREVGRSARGIAGGRSRAGNAARVAGRFAPALHQLPTSHRASVNTSTPPASDQPLTSPSPSPKDLRSDRECVAELGAHAREPDPDDLPPPDDADPAAGCELPPDDPTPIGARAADFGSLPAGDPITAVLELLRPIREAVGVAWSHDDIETTKALLRQLASRADVPMPQRAVRILRAFHADPWAKSEGFPLRVLLRQWSAFDAKGADLELTDTREALRRRARGQSPAPTWAGPRIESATWRGVLAAVAKVIGPKSFQDYLEPLVAVAESDGHLVVAAPSQLVHEWVMRNFVTVIEEALATVAPGVRVELVVAS